MRIQDSVVKPFSEPWKRDPARYQNAPEGSQPQASDGVGPAIVHRVLTPALGARCLEQLAADIARGNYWPLGPELSCSIIEEHLAVA